MPLSPGTRLGPYEIVAPLGAGGMGEVYRAKDTRLGRDVAVKVLPQHLTSNPEIRARFEREAKTVSSLNHPHICTLHDVGREGDTDFLVMELIEGETLAARLAKGALPLADVLKLGAQIADALDRAHRAGVMHRDLKPGNVMLTKSGAKLMDFGLAHVSALGATSELTSSPTVASPITAEGTILGTFPYMAPEQLEGKETDARAELWAFGCVLYEMATGKRAFGGTSQASLIAAIINTEPAPLGVLAPMSPPAFERLVKQCLAKDPDDRWQSAGDLSRELKWIAEGGSRAEVSTAAVPRRAGGWPWIAGGLLAGALAAFGGLRLLAPSVPAPELRKFSLFAVGVVGGETFISPDGRLFVYASRSRLWLRDLSRFEATEIPGSEGALSAFWSPDGTHVGFMKDRRIWTWALAGGQSTNICAIPGVEGFNGAAWGSDGKIYLAAYRGGLYEVAAAGGEPRLVLAPGSDEVDFHSPCLLPDGRHLVTVAHSKKGASPVIVVSLTDWGRKDLASFEGIGNVVYAPSGHLLLNFTQITQGRQKILAVPFNESTREITGEAFLVAAGGQHPSVSSTGTMLYYLGASYAQRELTWVEHEGRSTQMVGRSQLGLDSPALSPDGHRVAVVAYEKENADIWIHDLSRGTRSRLVTGPQDEIEPAWSPSGDRIFFLQPGNTASTLMEIPADGTGTPRSLAEGVATDSFAVSPDGRALAFSIEKEGHRSLWRLDLAADAVPVRLTPNDSLEMQPAISPDGRWLAYVSDEAGPLQVFVRSFPDGAHKQQVSLNEGTYPFWARTGTTILYWERDALMEVPVQAGASLAVGAARRLFTAADVGMLPSEATLVPALDLAADGRFLFVRRSSDDPRGGILVVENWIEEFRKR